MSTKSDLIWVVGGAAAVIGTIYGAIKLSDQGDKGAKIKVEDQIASIQQHMKTDPAYAARIKAEWKRMDESPPRQGSDLFLQYLILSAVMN